MTRRVAFPNRDLREFRPDKGEWWFRGRQYRSFKDAMDDVMKLCKFFKGDILYVRETFSTYKHDGKEIFVYKTHDRNKKILEEVGNHVIKWRPSIHMPKDAARIFLRVTDVRAERLTEITREDALKEGADEIVKSAVFNFVDIWNGTLKKADRGLYGWDSNPWVWVIEFEQICKGDVTDDG